MGTARTRTAALTGIGARLIDVEADIASGLPATVLAGLPDSALREARDRIRAAIVNSGESWPGSKITVSLYPAALPKRGSGYDLAIAVAIMTANGDLPAPPDATMFLAEVAAWLRGGRPPHREPPRPGCDDDPAPVRPQPDLADVPGQAQARRALEICAAGGHHLSLLGPAGAGTTMLAERLPTILPPLETAAALEVTSIRSVAGALVPGTGLITDPPFCAPHHTASKAAIVGGGSGLIRPGAASLAHRGVLFLDQAPEFRRDVLDALRQPLESGKVMIARASVQERRHGSDLRPGWPGRRGG